MIHTTKLDRDVLAELRTLEAIQPGMLAEIACLFLETIDQRVETIANAEELEVVIQAAHAIKGSSGALGASGLCMIAGEIEKDARAGRPPTPHLAALRHALEAVRPAITALR